MAYDPFLFRVEKPLAPRMGVSGTSQSGGDFRTSMDISVPLSLWTPTASLTWWLRRPPRERKIRGSNPACAGIFPGGSSPTSDLKIGTLLASLPGVWRFMVRAGCGWPGVSILWLGEVESLICNFYLSVAACSWDVPEKHQYVAGL